MRLASPHLWISPGLQVSNMLGLFLRHHVESCCRPCVMDTGNNILSSALLGDHILEGPYDLDAQ